MPRSALARRCRCARSRDADHGDSVERWRASLMERIGEVVPVLPVPLVARALLQAKGPLTAKTCCEPRSARMMDALPHAHVHLPRDDRAYAAEVGIAHG